MLRFVLSVLRRVSLLLALLVALAMPLPVLAATALDITFAPNPVDPGAASTLTFTFLNSDPTATTVNPSAPSHFTLPAGMTASGVVGNSCGFNGNAVAGSALTIGTGGSVPGNDGTCAVAFGVNAPAVGGQTWSLSIPVGAFVTSDGSNPPSTAGLATLTTNNPRPVTIAIMPPPHALANAYGGPPSDTAANRTITYTLTNPNFVPLTGAGMSFGNPGFTNATGEGAATTCTPGTVAIVDGQPVLSGATIPAGGSCSVSVPLQLCCNAFGGAGDPFSATSNYGTLGVVLDAGRLTSNEGATNERASSSIGGQGGVAYGKRFDVSIANIGQTVTMTLPIRSYTAYPMSYSLTDAIPSAFHVTGISVVSQDGSNPAAAATTCNVPPVPAGPGPALTFTGSLGGNVGSSFPAGFTGAYAACIYTVTLVADSVDFNQPAPSNIVQIFTNTLPLATLVDLSGAATDGLEHGPNPATATVSIFNCTTNCVDNSLSVTQRFVSPLGSVDEGEPGNPRGQIAWGGDGVFTLTIGSSAAVNGLTVEDTFTLPTPNRVIVATPTTYLAGPSTTCGGVLTATPGSTSFRLTGGTLAAGATCRIDVPVHQSKVQSFTDIARLLDNVLVPGTVYAIDAATGATRTNVTTSRLSLSLAVSAGVTSQLAASNNTILPGGKTQLILTPYKAIPAGTAPMGNAYFVWDLSTGAGGARIQATRVVSTQNCGPNVQVVDNVSGRPIDASAPSSVPHVVEVTMDDATPTALAGYAVPAGGLFDPAAYRPLANCRIVLDIEQVGTTPTGAFNMVGDNYSLENLAAGGDPSFGALSAGSQPIVIAQPSPMAITKSFSPAPVVAGQPVTLAITFDNSSGTVVDLTGIRFVDEYPQGMVNGATPDVTLAAAVGRQCSAIGTGTLAASPGGASVAWNGGTMRAGDVCVLGVTVTPLASGLTNTLYAAAGPGHAASFVNDQGVTMGGDFSAVLGTTQSIGVTKRFSPEAIWSGQSSTLTITLLNFYGNATDTGSLRVNDVAGWPAGVTATAVASTACGITATLAAGGSGVTLSGGTIPAGASCDVAITVTSVAPGSYTNVVRAGDMTATVSGGATSNTGAASAPLTVYAPLTITKTVTSSDGRVTGVNNAFNFTLSNCADPANAAGVTASVTLNGALSGSTTVDGLVPDTCTLTETAPGDPPANYAWDTTPAPIAITTTMQGPNAATVANALVRRTASIALTKTVTGGPASGVAATFDFNADCAASDDGTYSGSVTLAGATSGTGNIAGVPVGANCTVSEAAPAATTAPAGYRWGATPAPVVFASIGAGSNAAGFTNVLDRLTSDLVIDKTVTGAPATGLDASFVFTTACTLPEGAIAGSPFTSTIRIASPATTGTAMLANIPAGASCTVTETPPAAASAPANYAWGATPAAQTLVMRPGAGSNAVSFTNALTRLTGELVVTKTLTGGPSGYGAAFPVTVQCVADGVAVTPAEGATQTVTATNASAGSVRFTQIPQGARCSVGEDLSGVAPPDGYRYETPVIAQPADAIGATALVASVTNKLARTDASLRVQVSVTGGPDGYVGDFPISLDCTLDGATVAGIVPPSPTSVTAGSGAPSTIDYTGVPQGATCTIGEGALPPPPAGYRWDVPILAQPATIAAVDNRGSVVNPLVRVAPPVIATPVPLDSPWMRITLGGLLVAVGLFGVTRARRE